ncbi:MAG: hypothetical protein EBS79_04000 [Gammaproteobacteria bacterium]|nr:hypothetical protein [Gammaproteobacteria bacterium]
MAFSSSTPQEFFKSFQGLNRYQMDEGLLRAVGRLHTGQSASFSNQSGARNKVLGRIDPERWYRFEPSNHPLNVIR